MSWHIRPKDDEWKRATLTRWGEGKLWLHCGGCFRSYTVRIEAFIAFHGLAPETPFLIVNERMRCVSCGESKGMCRPEPYGIEERRVFPVVGSPDEGPQPFRRILQPQWVPPRRQPDDVPQVEF